MHPDYAKYLHEFLASEDARPAGGAAMDGIDPGELENLVALLLEERFG